MNKFRDKLLRFMQGRYGADDLYRFSAAAAGILLILNIFLKSYALWLFLTILLIWIYYRALSRNIGARQAENRAFLKIKGDVGRHFRIAKLMIRDRKTYCYKKCPVCKKMLRLPRRKGRHTVNCPQCKNDFNVKI
ncbi:MAG: hypothetical protein ACI4J5_00285 [Oscillospiraceae bacterium]